MRFHHHAARGVGLVLHRVATIAIGAAVILGVLLSIAAWRLSHGPVDLGWLTRRIEANVNAGSPIRVTIGHTALAWEGFRLGVDRPLDLRLSDIRVSDAGGVRHVEIPLAAVSLSLRALLLGQFQPRALELDRPLLTVRRAEDGTVSIDLGAANAAPTPGDQGGEPLAGLLALLARPPADDDAAAPRWFSQLQRLRIADGAVTVIDRRLGATWQVPRANITLNRHPQGGMDGAAELDLALGDQHAQLTATARLSPDATQTHVDARIGAVAPAALARQAPSLAFLAAVNAPVSAQAHADFGPDLGLRDTRVVLEAGAGTLAIAGGAIALAGASLVATGTPAALHVEDASVRVSAHPGAAVSAFSASGMVRSGDGRIEADVTLGLDQVAFADLPALWPAGLAQDARSWVIRNITAGTARDGHVAISLAANGDLSGMTLTRASGTLQGSDLTVSWLQPVPPVVQARAVLRVVDPDTLQIDLGGGQQRLRSGNTLAITGGSVRITGLTQRDQVATVRAGVTGALPDVIALLREPRLQLLDRHPMPLTDPAGQVTASVNVVVPLESAVQMDDIAINITAHLEQANLGGLVAGRDLSGGTLDLTATNDGLTVKGTARVAGIPARLDAAMDFRAGPPNQVVTRASLSGQPDARQLAALGLDAGDFLTGSVGLDATLQQQRDGTGSVTVEADLSQATLTVAPLDWRRPLGAAAHASALLQLHGDALDAIGRFAASGDAVTLRGSAQCQDGRIVLVRLDRVALGRTQMGGTVSFPARPRAGPIAVRLDGPVLDLAARLARPRAGRHPPSPEPAPGPPWTLDARFERVVAAHGYLLAPLRVHAEDDGVVLRSLQVDGFTGDKAPFALQIAPEAGGRRLTATAAKGGDLLRALDVTDTIYDGALTLSGRYDDTAPQHPLHATAELAEFRVARAVGLGKLLQAMTLYGLVDALHGSGLSFSRLVAPFTLADGVLTLSDARAFSPSLGLTAKGRLDLDGGIADLQGTIVPAYFFNSLLGNVPLIGRLFSPERGGGLFAASYSLTGNLDDPEVSVNPLTALTPGFLRGVFGIF